MTCRPETGTCYWPAALSVATQMAGALPEGPLLGRSSDFTTCLPDENFVFIPKDVADLQDASATPSSIGTASLTLWHSRWGMSLNLPLVCVRGAEIPQIEINRLWGALTSTAFVDISATTIASSLTPIQFAEARDNYQQQFGSSAAQIERAPRTSISIPTSSGSRPAASLGACLQLICTQVVSGRRDVCPGRPRTRSL